MARFTRAAPWPRRCARYWIASSGGVSGDAGKMQEIPLASAVRMEPEMARAQGSGRSPFHLNPPQSLVSDLTSSRIGLRGRAGAIYSGRDTVGKNVLRILNMRKMDYLEIRTGLRVRNKTTGKEG